MSCCNGGTPRSTRAGSVRRTPPKPTAKRTWTVTYTESGQEHTQEFTGGRSQELAAHRLSAQKRGSIRMSVKPLDVSVTSTPKSVASEVTLSVPDTPTDQAPVEEPEEKPVAKKTAVKKTTRKKAVAAK